MIRNCLLSIESQGDEVLKPGRLPGYADVSIGIVAAAGDAMKEYLRPLLLRIRGFMPGGGLRPPGPLMTKYWEPPQEQLRGIFVHWLKLQWNTRQNRFRT